MTSSAFFKPASSTRFDNEAPGATGRSGQNGRRGEIRWPPMGRSDGHPWGVSMAAYGEIPMAAVIRCTAANTGAFERFDSPAASLGYVPIVYCAISRVDRLAQLM